ncbi:MAG: cobalamin-dependent protein [Anaerolineaceae bacterium]|nr:cobalamin-dependent protein [Anaerolineaceae bacterium]
MSSTNHIPTFNMKVVVHETGLKPDTLRAWERRYGVPNPQRTQGGHRLYSQHEIDMLKWLVARQDEGMSISHAVELWQQLESEGQNPLISTGTAVAEPPFPHITGEQVDELRAAWLEACLAFDEYQAQLLLARAFALFPLETVCYHILQQGLTEIGEGWYEGRITVQQEHFASALAVRQVEALMAALPAATRNGRIIVACPPGEQHTFSSLLISLMLRRQGWDVVYLGANVPVERMEAAVQQIKPVIVVLSAQTLTTAASLLAMAKMLSDLDVPLAFGGAVFNNVPQVVEAVPGHFLGKLLAQVPQTIEKLIQATPPISKAKEASKTYQAAYHHFVERRPAIEAYLHASPALADMPVALLANTNYEFGNNLEAGLRLGDLAMVNSNLDWVQGLLLNNHRRLTKTSLDEYLAQYHEAVKKEMDKRAAPILHWFEHT